uniref:Uncharacterized protein n=1 Tax=Arundo donax TaxID=35708 RepID=A0A0A8ZD36_ARUDO
MNRIMLPRNSLSICLVFYQGQSECKFIINN